jgi:hypothetical protein
MSAIDRIRRAVQQGRYLFTDHAVEETQADKLLLRDVVDVLMHGEIDSTYTDDLRGTRYVVRGDIGDDEVDVVCRFRLDGVTLVIITVYVVD